MAEYQSPEWHPAFEEYCETIFELREDDVDVIQARIAERLDVSRPAVSEMIKRMEHEGLVAVDGTRIDLTAAGTRLAERVVRRHRLAERFLTDMLGLSWADAHKEAGKWEHVISDDGRGGDRPGARRPDHVPARQPDPGLRLPRARRRRRSASSRRRGFTVDPHPRGARVHPRAARVPRGLRRSCPAAPARSPRRRPTAPPPSRSTATTSASAPSPPPASSSPPDNRQNRAVTSGARARKSPHIRWSLDGELAEHALAGVGLAVGGLDDAEQRVGARPRARRWRCRTGRGRTPRARRRRRRRGRPRRARRRRSAGSRRRRAGRRARGSRCRRWWRRR